jgi:glycine reductase
MRLEVWIFPIREIEFGGATTLDGERLTVDREGLRRLILEDSKLHDVKIEIARPGESVRIVHALDIVEPRVKIEGPGGVFPGLIGSVDPAGRGRTHRLAGVAVIATGDIPEEDEGKRVRESVIDMSGPGADLSPFGKTLNLVLSFELSEGLSGLEADRAIRQATLKAAVHLAETTRGQTATETRVYELPPVDPAHRLPRIVHIIQVMTYSPPTVDVLVYGRNLTQPNLASTLPVIMHPNETLDGAIVSGNFHFACQRNATYFLQNNPVLDGLYRRHGKDLELAGMILAPGYRMKLEDKDCWASYAAKEAMMLGATGAVITQEGGGNGIIDVMLICRHCERLGIKTVVLVNELANPDGADFPLPDVVPEADAIVSAGNREQMVVLPPIDRALGGEDVFDPDQRANPPQPARGEVTVPIRQIYGSTNQLGYGALTARYF